MDLIIAEKPKVAEKIAHAICEKVSKKNSGGVSYYTGTSSDGTEIAVAPAVGHLYTLVEEKKSSTYPVFDIKWVPSYTADKDAAFTKPYVLLLQSLAKEADAVTVACDYDIEGSLIGYNVYRYTAEGKKAQRMKFSALTTSDLREAFLNRGELDYSNAKAGEARHIVDWYYGINLSRALMGAIRAANRYKVMSIGRVQGPALEILAQLERKIKAFIPSPYWELFATIQNVEFKHKEDRFIEEQKAVASYENTLDSGMVSSVEKKEVTVATPPNFDLTALQVEAYRVFGFAPSRTLQITQSLYEDSLISYPRTSSNQIPDSINTKAILQKLSKIKDYSDLADSLLLEGKTKPFQGTKSDPAHPAIHPTGQSAGLDGQEKKLYDLIVRRFLSSFSTLAKKERTKVEIDSNGEMYGAQGSVMKDAGWTKFYGPYYKSEDVDLPAFEPKSRVKLDKKEPVKKMTKPPGRFTEASIISELEKHHLGTKATRSVVIDTLFKRGYLDGKSIQVTDFGLKVVDVLEKYAPEILDEALTGKIEEEMELVQEGKLKDTEITKEAKDILTGLLKKWKTKELEIGNAILGALAITQEKESHIGLCDKCKTNNLRIIRMRGGKQFVGCSGYPDCKNAYPLPGGAGIKVQDKPCESCGKQMILVLRSGSRPFTMCIDPKCPSKANWGKPKLAGGQAPNATPPKGSGYPVSGTPSSASGAQLPVSSVPSAPSTVHEASNAKTQAVSSISKEKEKPVRKKASPKLKTASVPKKKKPSSK